MSATKKPRHGADIDFSDLGQQKPAEQGAAPVPHRPKTAPALNTLAFFENNALQGRVSELEAEVQRLAAERGAMRLDPATIRPSRWANRHEASFAGKDFEALKAEIESAGGNVQPIMVRPAAGEGGTEYEVVFGHRRHRACAELGLPVAAVVNEVGDAELFALMDRENRLRKDLSPWEQGAMYLRALDAGLFPSVRRLAAAVGADSTNVSRALQLARLPAEVVAAFPSPMALQYRWSKPLAEALERDPEAMLEKARELAGKGRPAAEVMKALAEPPAEKGAVPYCTPVRHIEAGPGRSATIRLDAKGRLTVEASAGAFPEDRLQELEETLRRLLG